MQSPISNMTKLRWSGFDLASLVECIVSSAANGLPLLAESAMRTCKVLRTIGNVENASAFSIGAHATNGVVTRLTRARGVGEHVSPDLPGNMGFRLGRLPLSSWLGQVSGGQWDNRDQRRARGPSNVVVSVTGRVLYTSERRKLDVLDRWLSMAWGPPPTGARRAGPSQVDEAS